MVEDTETYEGPPDGATMPAQGGLKAVIDLLNGSQDSAPETETPETGNPADTPPAEKWDLKTVAEKLSVDPAKFYELKVKAGDGHELSIGELKDAWKSKADLDGFKAEVDKQKAEWMADQIRTQRELQEVLSAIDPQSVKPELIQAWQRQQAEAASREREMTLRRIPEWSDARVEAKDKAAMVEAFKAFGYSPAELADLRDHRAFLMGRELVRLQAEVAALKTKPAPKVAVAPKAGKPQTDAQQFGRVKAAVSSGRMTPQAAVERLLRGN